MARSREVHDFWHVLFDCHTNVFGELALKALEFVQVSVGSNTRLCPSALRQSILLHTCKERHVYIVIVEQTQRRGAAYPLLLTRHCTYSC